MPNPKDIGAYPQEFWHLPRAVLLTAGKTLRVEFTSKNAAVAWRLRFNSWRKLVLELDFEQSAMSAEEFSCLKALTVRLETAAVPTLVFQHSDHTEVALAIRAAIEAAGITPRVESSNPPDQAVGTTLYSESPLDGASASEEAARDYLSGKKES